MWLRVDVANFFVCLIVYFLSSDKALERVSQFPVYLDSPDSDPEELNEFNTLLTEFFSVACNDPRRGRKAALVHAGDNKPVLAIHLRAEVSAPRVLPKFKLPDYIEKDDPDHARGRDLWCRCLDPPIDAEDGFGDTHRLRYLEAFAERNRRQLHQESIDLLHFGAMWRTPSVILRALIWAMDRACTQATVVQRVLKTLKSQMREANGNSVSRFMSSSSRGKKQVQPAPTLPSAARRGAFPQPMEGQKEQGLMEVSIAKLANRRSEKQKVADSVEVQIPQVDHHHKPDNSKAEEVLLSDDAQQCDFCMCFDQVQAELSRQVAQGSSFTSAELYIPIIIWLTKNCANQNLLTMLLFADAFLAFEFPDKLEASRGWLDVARNSIVDFALHADSPELRAQGEMDAATVEIFEAGADISTWVHPENDVSAGASSKKPGSSTQGKHTGSSNNRAWRQFTQFWQALRS